MGGDLIGKAIKILRISRKVAIFRRFSANIMESVMRGVVCKLHLWYNIVVLKPQQSRKIVVCRPHSRKENI